MLVSVENLLKILIVYWSQYEKKLCNIVEVLNKNSSVCNDEKRGNSFKLSFIIRLSVLIHFLMLSILKKIQLDHEF